MDFWGVGDDSNAFKLYKILLQLHFIPKLGWLFIVLKAPPSLVGLCPGVYTYKNGEPLIFT